MGWSLLEHQTAPDSNGQFDFSGLDFGSYKRLKLLLDAFDVSNDGTFITAQFYISTLQTSGYRWIARSYSSGGSTAADNSTSDSSFQLNGGSSSAWGIGNAAGETFESAVDITNMAAGLYKQCKVDSQTIGPSGNTFRSIGAAVLENTGELDGILIGSDVGSILAGYASLYGLPSS